MVEPNPDDPSPLSVHETFGEREDVEKIAGTEEFRQWLEAVLSSGAAHAVIVNLLRYSSERAAS